MGSIVVVVVVMYPSDCRLWAQGGTVCCNSFRRVVVVVGSIVVVVVVMYFLQPRGISTQDFAWHRNH